MAKQKTHKIVSTLSQSVNFETYETDALGNKTVVRRIKIGGGANVWDGIVVPSGFGTLVSDEELEVLRKNPAFVAFEKGCWISVVGLKTNQDAVIEDMQEKDKSAQRTIADVGKDVKVANKNGEILVETQEQEENDEVEISVKSVKKTKGAKKGSKKSK